MACRIIGCGGYLPESVLTNQDLELKIDTSDEWIRTRTGIRSRHIANESEFASHMAFKASKAALLDAGLDASDIDMIIVATTTSDDSFPSTATKLQHYLSAGTAPAFDLQSVCSGFIYGLEIASNLMREGKYRNILLVATEKMSSLLDWSDRSTCVLFGDGAGAVILQHSDLKQIGILDTVIYSEGRYGDLLHTDGGISSTETTGKIRMKGPALFKQAVDKMTSVSLEILKKNHISVDNLDYIIPHQANIRIIDAIGERLGIDPNKLVKTIATHANCSAASIPLAISHMKSQNKISEGDLILCTAFGAGLTWGASLIKW
jgi:3-oxoacyl-[acyl-carrier-protein] synthase-3